MKIEDDYREYSERSATPSWAWLFVLLLMPVALLNYLDRQMMATMRDSVMESIPEFHQPDNPQK
ncbi:MAG: hypothetical protein ACKOAU_14280, partial [Pirellula sp.]